MFSADAGVSVAAPYVEDVFSAYAYTGTGASNPIVNGINFSTYGGLLWIKIRDTAVASFVADSSNGLNYLSTNLQDPLTSASGLLTSLNSNGFTVAGVDSRVNNGSKKYISWCFRKSPGFFDIQTYAGNGSTQVITHALGVTPGMVIIKCTNQFTTDWVVWHNGISAGNYAKLNSTAAQTTTSASNFFGNNSVTVNPTASGITVGSNASINGGSSNYVAYIFGHDTSANGLIQCGTFTTDGSGNATVTLGNEPQYILVKKRAAIGSWVQVDTARVWDMSTVDAQLVAEATTVEATADIGNPTATGFQFVGSASTAYIYMTIRKGLMRIPTDATKVFAIDASTGTGAARSITGVAFPPDLAISKKRGAVNKHNWQDRIRGTASQLTSDSTAAETTSTDVITSFNQNGVTFGADATQGSVNTSAATYINYLIKEAKGYFDKVRYVGTGSAHAESHNLGVVPELMLVKGYSSGTTDWQVYYGDNTKFLVLNTTAAGTAGSTVWNNTSPTSSVFTVGTSTAVNNSTVGYIAYLFASVTGVSKVGTYTGNGTTNSINCGFAAGARFVMIKRIDSTGDWYYYDTTRGIVASTEGYLLFNSTAAEVTGNDYIDPYSPGFELSSTAPAALNANGGSFLFFAVA